MQRRRAPVYALFFLAPLVAEFILGDFPVVLLPMIVLLAPIYGGGALVIREVTRRTGRGWPTMLLLASAYGVLEEGLLTQSLFDPHYAGQHLLSFGYVPPLGIALPWTIYVVGIHALWSIATPIALVEEATGPRRTTPWLGRRGLAVVAAVFVAGAAITFVISYLSNEHFMASVPQLASSAAIVAVLSAAAFLMPRLGGHTARSDDVVPRPWLIFALITVAGALFMGVTYFRPGVGVPIALAVLALTAVQVGRWSTRTAWDRWHRFAIAGGALFTYGWHAFTLGDEAKGVELVLNIVSHVVFGLATAWIVWFSFKKITSGGHHGQAAA
jgi:hypothetical protein